MSVMGEWTRHGACRDGNYLDDFFASARGAPGRNLPIIRAICDSCPVKRECEEWAVPHEEFGIWAGLTENQRKNIRTALGIRLETPEVGILPKAEKTGPRDPIQHGTLKGYKIEVKHGIPTCAACKEAMNIDSRARRAAKKELENA